MKRICQRIRDDRRFEPFIIFVILAAGVLVGLETSEEIMAQYGRIIHVLDKIVLGIFIIEIVIKMGAELPNPGNYFRSGWNVFDFSIVAVCLLPGTGAWVTVVRLARILRAARLVTQIPRLQVLIGAILKSLPSMAYVSILLALFFYVYAVMGTFMFRGNDPGHFGDLGRSMTTLFRVVTLEDWTDVMYTAFHGSNVYNAQGPIPVGKEPHAFGYWGVFYFSSFVIIGAMVMINLFVGVMVNSLSDAEADELRKKLHLDTEEAHDLALEAKMAVIEKELLELKHLLKGRKSG
ncbi:MAG: voltage-gated sodium channel [Candidatus Binatia bacterium]|jgi:voltage-gated sodium channel